MRTLRCRGISVSQDLCSGVDGTGGALAFTCTAVDAGVGVDVVLGCTLGDGLGGANGCTSSAGDAGVFNNVSHCDRKC